MLTEKIGIAFENFKTLSTFRVCCHLMHCSSISCTSNFYENLKRLLVDSLITFPLTTSVCLFGGHCHKKKTSLISFLPFHFHFWERQGIKFKNIWGSRSHLCQYAAVHILNKNNSYYYLQDTHWYVTTWGPILYAS